MTITVYTVITCDYDDLMPPLTVEPSVRYICFSDRERHCAPYEVLPFPRYGLTARAASRVPKMLPHLLMDADVSIYHDGQFSLQAPAASLIAEMGAADMAMFQHPFNATYGAEVDFYRANVGRVPDHVATHAQRLRDKGITPESGWWAGGFLVRRHNERTAAFGESWMRHFVGGSSNDQFGLLEAVHESGVSVATLRGDIRTDPRLRYWLHAGAHAEMHPELAAENKRWAARRERIAAASGTTVQG